MKGVLIGIFLFAAVSTLTAQPDLTYSDETGTLILLGQGDRSDMEKPPFDQWFNREYETYQPDQSVVSALEKPVQDIHVTIILGTWCPDSRREVPRFFMILDKLGFSNDSVTVYYVNGDKSCTALDERNITVERVPTFIFSKKGVALGRIVETPVESLEKDMKKIILKE